jgi:tryptophanyl-tRNA synthetase
MKNKDIFIMTLKKRILSGIQPSGNLTIGNYIGALRQWVREQDEYDCLYCVVDLHAITVPQDAAQLRAASRSTAATLLAVGLDPQRCTIFLQSHVRAHAELGWLLTCQTPLGWLYRMTQFKDKSAKLQGDQQDSVGAGLLVYPVLMAADILLYQTHAVPVGDDQRQHLELTRDLAQRFNHQYGDTFRLPEGIIPKEGARIMGLDNPLSKMSKSEKAEGHAVALLDAPNVIRKKFMRAVTDSGREIRFTDDPDKAGVNNLLTIYQAMTDETREQIEAHFDGKGYGDLKKAVGEAVAAKLEPFQQRYHEFLKDGGFVDEVLRNGAIKAAEIANATLNKARERLGLVTPF